jgi:hypothetical protein
MFLFCSLPVKPPPAVAQMDRATAVQARNESAELRAMGPRDQARRPAPNKRLCRKSLAIFRPHKKVGPGQLRQPRPEHSDGQNNPRRCRLGDCLAPDLTQSTSKIAAYPGREQHLHGLSARRVLRRRHAVGAFDTASRQKGIANEATCSGSSACGQWPLCSRRTTFAVGKTSRCRSA